MHFSFLYINWVTCHWWVPFNYHLFIGTVVLLHPHCHFPCISPLLSSLSTLSPGLFPPPFWSSSHCPCPPPSLPVFAAQAFSGASSCIFADLGLTASASYLGPSLSCWAWCPWRWGCFLYWIEYFANISLFAWNFFLLSKSQNQIKNALLYLN